MKNFCYKFSFLVLIWLLNCTRILTKIAFFKQKIAWNYFHKQFQADDYNTVLCKRDNNTKVIAKRD